MKLEGYEVGGGGGGGGGGALVCVKLHVPLKSGHVL